MLDRLDLEKIFAVASKSRWARCEAYGETTYRSVITVQGRVRQVRLVTTEGIALRCSDGHSVRHFSASFADTATVLRWLQGEPPLKGSGGIVAAESRIPQPCDKNHGNTSEKTGAIDAIARAFMGESERLRFPAMHYEDTTKHFEVANESGMYRAGREEWVEISGDGIVDGKDGPVHCRVERAGASTARLLAECVERHAFQEEVRRFLKRQTTWPCPSGELPVLWSARALAKLFHPFLAAFEGDAVLGNHSFLTDLKLPVDLPFRVTEEPDTDALPWDNEGSPRRAMTLFEGGQPRALACNNAVAEQLAVASTGHCRRQSFQVVPTIGFWSPRVIGEKTTARTLAGLEQGISVHDIEILRFHPSTADIEIRVTDAALVHHGEEGEWVDPFPIRGNLLHLLGRLDAFGESAETVGLASEKRGQRFGTELTLPPVVSAPLLIEGAVPMNHYW